MAYTVFMKDGTTRPASELPKKEGDCYRVKDGWDSRLVPSESIKDFKEDSGAGGVVGSLALLALTGGMIG